MDRFERLAVGLVGGSAVAMAAFGAHALKGRLGEEAMGWYGTASQYHLLGSLALLGFALAGNRLGFRLLLAGLAIFALSLYLLAFSGARWLGAVTPIGGALQIAAWLTFALRPKAR
jgi:uncharacterized membrane protein YgdD (TMEM256/DUF423 family)